MYHGPITVKPLPARTRPPGPPSELARPGEGKQGAWGKLKQTREGRQVTEKAHKPLKMPGEGGAEDWRLPSWPPSRSHDLPLGPFKWAEGSKEASPGPGLSPAGQGSPDLPPTAGATGRRQLARAHLGPSAPREESRPVQKDDVPREPSARTEG